MAAWMKTNYKIPADILDEEGLLKRLTKRIVEQALQAEMTHHLGDERYAAEGRNSGNSRNGSNTKRLKTEDGKMMIAAPRNRDGTFQPILVKKRQRRLGKFDDLVISLYTREMTQEQISEHLREIYGVEASVELCIVHLIRNSLRQVACGEMKKVAADLKPIYTAPTAEAAEQALAAFDQKWGSRYPMIARAWRSVWPNVIPFFKFPEDIRRAIYTTNAIESVNASIGHITSNRALFPSDEAIFKFLYLALMNAARKWTMPIKKWAQALQRFAIFFEGRAPLPGIQSP
ncbi:MAG: transposase [Candidatus Roseilinea sp.]|uniref:transposase n=1 Tax=Candidatus Roseilinea sp. TaxID=2838777 RepID=UPI00404A5678